MTLVSTQTAPCPRRSHRMMRFAALGAVMGTLTLTGAALHAQELTVLPAPATVGVEATVAPFSSSAASADAAAPAIGQPAMVAEADLPEAPLPQGVVPPKPAGTAGPNAQPVAPVNSMMIPAGWRAQPLTARQKFVAGARDIYSLDNAVALVVSASYEQVLNSEPNYTSGGKAYGQRLGAAAVRETSQTIFTEMVFAPLLHEDDRYYQKGPSYNPVKRTLYAITRPLITRTDAGTQTINGALLLGYAASAALTPAFYPEQNRNFHDTASTFGGSIGGAALGFFVSEFSSDVLQALHLSHSSK